MRRFHRPKAPPLLRGLPLGHAACVAADVPWQYLTYSKNGLERSPERHYGTMTLESIAALPVARYCAKDAHLLFWVTGPHLAIGSHIPIMRAWGFEPTALWGVWIKPTRKAYEHGQLFLVDELFKMGMGHTSRQNAEFVVLGRRGKPERLSRSVRQVFLEPAREHSRKPEKFFAAAEKYCAGPRLELFGREERENWTVRGDQVGKFAK